MAVPSYNMNDIAAMQKRYGNQVQHARAPQKVMPSPIEEATATQLQQGNQMSQLGTMAVLYQWMQNLLMNSQNYDDIRIAQQLRPMVQQMMWQQRYGPDPGGHSGIYNAMGRNPRQFPEGWSSNPAMRAREDAVNNRLYAIKDRLAQIDYERNRPATYKDGKLIWAPDQMGLQREADRLRESGTLYDDLL